mmetsp:Transcript_64835/g.173363  ORF Transcript_64835/g.173363 Transcript_64835/m.173363 type:complete len:535 (+) Transcript_64835:303-1907(+)
MCDQHSPSQRGCGHRDEGRPLDGPRLQLRRHERGHDQVGRPVPQRHLAGPGRGPRRGLRRGVVHALRRPPLEAALRAHTPGVLRRRLGVLLRGAGVHRRRHRRDRRPGLADGLLYGPAGLDHGHHHRGAGHVAPRPLRLQGLRGGGPLRGQRHRERHRQQRRQRLPGPGAALDDGGLLLGRQRHGEVEAEVPRAGRALPERRVRGARRRSRVLRARVPDVHGGRLRRRLLQAQGPRRRVGRPDRHQDQQRDSLRGTLDGLRQLRILEDARGRRRSRCHGAGGALQCCGSRLPDGADRGGGPLLRGLPEEERGVPSGRADVAGQDGRAGCQAGVRPEDAHHQHRQRQGREGRRRHRRRSQEDGGAPDRSHRHLPGAAAAREAARRGRRRGGPRAARGRGGRRRAPEEEGETRARRGWRRGRRDRAAQLAHDGVGSHRRTVPQPLGAAQRAARLWSKSSPAPAVASSRPSSSPSSPLSLHHVTRGGRLCFWLAPQRWPRSGRNFIIPSSPRTVQRSFKYGQHALPESACPFSVHSS